MFCTNCGKKIPGKTSFCIECGNAVASTATENIPPKSNFDQKWWLRLAKVIYFISYLPLLPLIVAVWDSYDPGYYRGYSSGSYEEAFVASLVAFAIYIIVMRLIKIGFLYIAFAQKPQWK